jgi:hypothetical protein
MTKVLPVENGYRHGLLRPRTLLGPLFSSICTILIVAAIIYKVPIGKLTEALAHADCVTFTALMLGNAVFYFFWDTWLLSVVMRWFHEAVPFHDLLCARAASYVVSLFNTNAARAVLAFYLKRNTGLGFLQLGSTVAFLVTTEFIHLTLWGTLGGLLAYHEIPHRLLFIAPLLASAWLIFILYVRLGVTPLVIRRTLRKVQSRADDPRDWPILRTFRIASAGRYLTVIVLRAPMFSVALVTHYLAARAFNINLPFIQVLTFLPVIFMVSALPVTVAHLGTTQAAWILFFGRYAPTGSLLAFSLAAHLSFTIIRAGVSLAFVARTSRMLLDRDQKPRRPTTKPPPIDYSNEWALH